MTIDLAIRVPENAADRERHAGPKYNAANSSTKEPVMELVTHGPAEWIVDRLLAEGIAASDVRRYLDEMESEIRTTERRIAALRGMCRVDHGTGEEKKGAAPRTTPTRIANAMERPRGIAGTLAVLLRSLPESAHAAIHAVRAEKGIRAPIDAAKLKAKTAR